MLFAEVSMFHQEIHSQVSCFTWFKNLFFACFLLPSPPQTQKLPWVWGQWYWQSSGNVLLHCQGTDGQIHLRCCAAQGKFTFLPIFLGQVLWAMSGLLTKNCCHICSIWSWSPGHSYVTQPPLAVRKRTQRLCVIVTTTSSDKHTDPQKLLSNKMVQHYHWKHHMYCSFNA